MCRRIYQKAKHDYRMRRFKLQVENGKCSLNKMCHPQRHVQSPSGTFFLKIMKHLYNSASLEDGRTKGKA